MIICRTETERGREKGHDTRAAGKAAGRKGSVEMGKLIDEETQRKIAEEVMETFGKHNLTLQEMEYFSRTFYMELKIKLNKKRQKEFADNLVGDMLGKFGLGGK